MRWKLGGLALLTALLIFVIVAPLFTLTVSVDLPPGTIAPTPDQLIGVATTTIWVVCGVLVIATLALAGWIARRIIRAHRNPN